MALAEIYYSSRLADCEQRAFVLRAVGIEHAVYARDDLFGLMVPEELARTAIDHLQSYDAESRVAAPVPQPLQLHPNAAIGSFFYTLIVVAVAYLAGEKAMGVDWVDAGALNASVIQSGQWWRVVTALTLHADVGHLLGNVAFGAPFGFFAAQLLGTGRAWASILIAAALGNFLDSMLMPAQQVTIGASTAVFAMLGLVAAYSWRRGSGHTQRWALKWAPLIAGIALLGFTGTGGENTDVLAHLAGFASGVLLGIAHAHIDMSWLDSRRGQFIAGVATLATVIIAWRYALSASI